MRRFRYSLALAALLPCFGSGQTPPAHYTVTDLSALGAGDVAVLWGINNSSGAVGEVMAASGDTRSVAFRQNTLTTLKAVTGGSGARSSARGVNDAGQVVGSYLAAPDVRHGYVIKSDGATDLHALVSLGGPGSFAAGINNSGDIVGASSVDSAAGAAGRHAFLYNGTVRDLDPDVSLGGAWSEALGINDAGDIVGASQTAGGECYHAFFIRGADNSVTDLHSTVQAGGCSSRANGINAKGEIVGAAIGSSGGSRAFLYANGQVIDLNNLIPANSGWVLESAHGISNDEQIVGAGQYMGQPRTFLLAQAPASASPGDGVLAVSQVVNSQDVYLNQNIAVRGKVQIVVLYGSFPCPPGDSSCTPILDILVFLQDLQDRTKKLSIYRNGNPFKCQHDNQGNPNCGQFVNNSVITLNGVYSKGKQPDFVIGSASPSAGGSPPQAITFKDFYYFDISQR